jgi:hypothetical protein
MERYCGYLQAGLRSRTHPWANLNNRLLHKAYLEQIDIYYDLQDDLTITSSTDLKRGEKIFEGCRFPEYLRYFMILTCNDARPTLNLTPTLSSFIPTRQTVTLQDRPLLYRCDQQTSFQHREAPPDINIHLGKSESCGVRGFYPSSIE